MELQSGLVENAQKHTARPLACRGPSKPRVSLSASRLVLRSSSGWAALSMWPTQNESDCMRCDLYDLAESVSLLVAASIVGFSISPGRNFGHRGRSRLGDRHPVGLRRTPPSG